jgi:hypothetical protein
METSTTTNVNDKTVAQPGATEQRTTRNMIPTHRRFQLLFTLKEAAAAAKLSHWTLRWWTKRGWVEPVSRTRVGRGKEYSAWQVIGMALIAGAHSDVRSKNRSYLDRGIIRDLAALGEQDDALLLAEDQHGDMYISERAAAIACGAVNSVVLTPEMVESLAYALAAIDKKAQQERNRLR